MTDYLLAIDQGTSSSRAIVFDAAGVMQAKHHVELTQHYPAEGWVEHDPEEIWQSVLLCCREALSKSGLSGSQITAVGISNQRETTIVWDKRTGAALYPAIVWQDRRTAELCQQLLLDSDITSMIQEKTGLVMDPYFCATKLQWLMQHVDAVKAAIKRGDALFGTVDSYLLWKLTAGKVHATDATNASRTLLFNINDQAWDETLLTMFSVPHNVLPEVKDSNAHFGYIDPKFFGAAIPITGIAGDQQAAMVGQACFTPGAIKSTYGTGCFLMLNTGEQRIASSQRLLSTVAYRINNHVTYALEGSIFVAGAAVQWLRDMLHLINHAGDSEALASSVDDTNGVYMVPAFTGLGAPYWDPLARGAIVGLTRNTGIAHIVRAALESVCYQTKDLLQAMQQDYQAPLQTLRVDGGMVQNSWMLQFLSNVLTLSVERANVIETSALGAAYLAGLGAGLYTSIEDISRHWQCGKTFKPDKAAEKSEGLYRGWLRSVNKVMKHD
jgi:glycerol kinase